MRRALALIAALVALALGAPGLARAEGGDSAAVAVNTKDGSSLFRLSFAIRHVMGDVVDQTNAAVAYASCTSCTTVAIAIEVVLVEGDPSTVTPENVAIAYNELCSLCVTFASAYQFVLSTGGAVHFTADGNRELASIRMELEQLKNADLTLEELRARLDDITARLATVLRTQLVAAGPPEDGAAQASSPGPTTGTTTEPPPGTTTAPTTTTGETTTTGPDATTTATTPTTTGTTTGP